MEPAVRDDSGGPGELSGLSLESLLPPSMGAGPAGADLPKQEIDSATVSETARFGAPDKGVVGALKYWIRVRARLKELIQEYDTAVGDCSSAITRKAEYCARLGRKGQEIGLEGEILTPLISKAAIAQGELKGTERRHSSLADEHKAKIEPIEKERDKVDAEAAPLRKKKSLANEELKRQYTERKGIEVRLKRAEIEMRNVDDLIAKKQEKYGLPDCPKEERDELLKDISAIDKRRPGILEQIKACEGEMEKLAGPIEKAESVLEQIEEVLDAKQGRIDELQSQINASQASYSQAEGAVAQKMENESEKVETAWTEVGERIVVERRSEPGLKELSNLTIGALTAADEAQQKVEVLSRAQNAYDNNVVKRAKIIVGAVVGGVVLIIVALAVFL